MWLAFAAVLTGGVVAAVVPSAHAVAMLQLSDTVTTILINDNGAGDLNPAAGVVLFSGGLGDFFINVSTGLTKPTLNTAGEAETDLNSVDVSLVSGPFPNTLTISFTDVDFTVPIGLATSIIAFGGTAQGTVSYSAYLDNTNTPFGMGTLLAALGPFGPGAFGVTGGGVVTTSDPFSLTSVVSITHPQGSNGGTASSSFDASIRIVPEPATLLLIGSVLLVAAAVSRRIRRAASAAGSGLG